jgi:small subunit ribosomal protein S16
MPAKIRLQRHGKKGKPFFHIVVADARSPRDGKYIERLGSYNPNTNPATIDINVDSAVNWLGNGAQPTDTARAILSYTGVLYKNHLKKGVSKGAFTEEEAVTRYETWKAEKDGKIDSKRNKLSSEKEAIISAQLASERAVNEAKAAATAAKEAELLAEAEAIVAAQRAAKEEAAAAKAAAEAPVVEDAPATEAPATEAPAAEAPATEENKENAAE